LNDKRDHRRGMASAAARAAKQAGEDYKAQFPDASALKLRTQVNAFKPRLPDIRDVPVRAVGLLLSEPWHLKKSNAELVRHLAMDVTGRKLPSNILTERLGASHKKRIGQMFEERNIAIDLATHDTVSKLKKALRSLRAADDAPSKFVGEVTFSRDAVTVGTRSLTIHRSNGVPRIDVPGGGKLNVDVLRRLLCETT
jgi:hypothetical protein